MNEPHYPDVKKGLFAVWPGRCAICQKVWWSECIHPDKKAGRGHFKSVRQQWIPWRRRWHGKKSFGLEGGALVCSTCGKRLNMVRGRAKPDAVILCPDGHANLASGSKAGGGAK